MRYISIKGHYNKNFIIIIAALFFATFGYSFKTVDAESLYTETIDVSDNNGKPIQILVTGGVIESVTAIDRYGSNVGRPLGDYQTTNMFIPSTSSIFSAGMVEFKVTIQSSGDYNLVVNDGLSPETAHDYTSVDISDGNYVNALIYAGRMDDDDADTYLKVNLDANKGYFLSGIVRSEVDVLTPSGAILKSYPKYGINSRSESSIGSILQPTESGVHIIKRDGSTYPGEATASFSMIEHVSDISDIEAVSLNDASMGSVLKSRKYSFGVAPEKAYFLEPSAEKDVNMDISDVRVSDDDSLLSDGVDSKAFRGGRDVDRLAYYNALRPNVYANIIEWSVSSTADDQPFNVKPNGKHFKPKSGDPAYEQVLELNSEDRADSLVADPVDAFAGNFIDNRLLLDYQGANALAFEMHYDSIANESRSLGGGFTHNFESYVDVSDSGANVYETPSRVVRFNRDSSGGFVADSPTMQTSSLVLKDGTYSFTNTSGEVYTFNDSGLVLSYTTLTGLTTEYSYSNGLLSRVENEKGQFFNFKSDANGRVISVTDVADRTVTFKYNKNGEITSVTTPNGAVYEMEYSDNLRKVTELYYDNTLLVRNWYDAAGRVSRQQDSLYNETAFTYDEFTNPDEIKTVIDIDGRVEVLIHDASGNLLSKRDGAGYTVVSEYDVDRNKISETDANGFVTTFKYDSLNRLIQTTLPNDGILTYEYDDLNNMTEFVDADGQFIINTYDGKRLVSVTNKNGDVTTHDYDAFGNILSLNRDGVDVQYKYDNNGHLIGTSQNGIDTVFNNDALGRVVKTVLADGSETSVAYDAMHNIVSSIDGAGNETVFKYNAFGNRTEMTNPSGVVTTYEYDTNGNLLKETTERRGVQYSYNAHGDVLTKGLGTGYTTRQRETFKYNKRGDLISHYDQDGVGEEYSYDGVGNLIERVVDDSVVTFEYDSMGQLIAEIDGVGNRTTHSYDLAGNQTSTTLPGGGLFKSEFDDLGRLISETDALGGVTTYDYDVRGNLIKETLSNDAIISYTYDGLNNLTSTTDPMGGVMTRTYDALGQLASVENALGHVVYQYEYDALGNITTVTDANNHSYELTYDANGQLISTTDALGNTVETLSYNPYGDETERQDALGNIVSYAYDSIGNVSSVADPLYQETYYSYTNAGRLEYTEDAMYTSTMTQYDYSGRLLNVGEPYNPMVRYQYDGNDNVISETFGNNALTYNYNENNQLDTATNGRGDDIQYEYDANGQVVKETSPEGVATFKYDYVGNLIESVNDNEMIERSYDLNGNVLSKTQNVETIQYEYDKAGQLIKLTYPSGDAVTYTYDKVGNMLTVTDWNDNVTTYSYNENNQHVKTVNANGVIETRSYDAAGQLSALTYKKGSAVLFDYVFEYDAAGNIVEENDKFFEYDALNRLVYTAVLEYNYSSYGNITSFSDGDVNRDMRYNNFNALTRIDGINTSLDKDGNLTKFVVDDTTHNATYDSKNRLVTYDDTEYSYDIEDNRIGVDSMNFVIDNDSSKYSRVLVTSDDGVVKQYVYGNGLIGDGSSTYIYDYRGSTVGVANSDGVVTGEVTYSDFGNVITKDDSVDISFLYNGQYGVQTDNNDLNYMRARYYNPEIKRFMNRDIVAGSSSEPQTLNRYAYVNGDPISYNDPFGLAREAASSGVLDFLHIALDTAGFIPGFGAVADLANAGLYLSQGNWTEAFWSGIGAVPGVGDGVSAVRIADRGVDIVDSVNNIRKNVSRVPKTKGSWSGSVGESNWFSDKQDVIDVTKGEPVQFRDRRPDFSPWSKLDMQFDKGFLDGTDADFGKVERVIARDKGFKNQTAARTWLRDEGLTIHHETDTLVQLIPTKLHSNIPHTGSASDMRRFK